MTLTRLNDINFLNWQIVQRYAFSYAYKVECWRWSKYVEWQLLMSNTEQISQINKQKNPNWRKDTEGSLWPTVAENWVQFNLHLLELHGLTQFTCYPCRRPKWAHSPPAHSGHRERRMIKLSVRCKLLLACFTIWPKFTREYFLCIFEFS